MPNDDTETDLFGEDAEENSDEEFDSTEILKNSTSQPMWVLPLYSVLPSNEQAKVIITVVLMLVQTAQCKMISMFLQQNITSILNSCRRINTLLALSFFF